MSRVARETGLCFVSPLGIMNRRKVSTASASLLLSYQCIFCPSCSYNSQLMYCYNNSFSMQGKARQGVNLGVIWSD